MEILMKNLSRDDAHKVLTGAVVPRPIALVSTKSPENVHNLAPFSYFTAVSSSPAMILVSVADRNGQKKDTLRNIERHPEFVVNVVTEDMAVPVNNAAADYRPDISEFDEVGLTPVPAKTVDCMAVLESPVRLECRLHQIIPLASNHLVIGEVQLGYVQDDLYIPDYKINVEALRPLARICGPYYAKLGEFMTCKRTFDPGKVIS